MPTFRSSCRLVTVDGVNVSSVDRSLLLLLRGTSGIGDKLSGLGVVVSIDSSGRGLIPIGRGVGVLASCKDGTGIVGCVVVGDGFCFLFCK